MESVPNCQKEIPVRHAIRWFKCKLKPPKNAWITLHMQDRTARQWADNMMDKETPGDEIALFLLCKQYHRHCIVLMSAKVWCTLDLPEPIPEADLYELCEIKLLFIEPGVYSELTETSSTSCTPVPNDLRRCYINCGLI